MQTVMLNGRKYELIKRMDVSENTKKYIKRQVLLRGPRGAVVQLNERTDGSMFLFHVNGLHIPCPWCNVKVPWRSPPLHLQEH